jgi:hypothetical protein
LSYEAPECSRLFICLYPIHATDKQKSVTLWRLLTAFYLSAAPALAA